MILSYTAIFYFIFKVCQYFEGMQILLFVRDQIGHRFRLRLIIRFLFRCAKWLLSSVPGEARAKKL